MTTRTITYKTTKTLDLPEYIVIAVHTFATANCKLAAIRLIRGHLKDNDREQIGMADALALVRSFQSH